MADKGYHSRAVLKDLDGGLWRSRIVEPWPKGVQRWHGDDEAQRAVYGNRARLRSGVAKEALTLLAERVERSFEHTLDRGGLRRTDLRGRANVQKRYLLHVAGFNMGLLMRALLGAGTPKELAARGDFVLWLLDPAVGYIMLVILQPYRPFEPMSDRSGPMDRDAGVITSEPQTLPSSTGCTGSYPAANLDWHEGGSPCGTQKVLWILKQNTLNPRRVCGVGRICFDMEKSLDRCEKIVGFDVSSRVISITQLSDTVNKVLANHVLMLRQSGISS